MAGGFASAGQRQAANVRRMPLNCAMPMPAWRRDADSGYHGCKEINGSALRAPLSRAGAGGLPFSPIALTQVAQSRGAHNNSRRGVATRPRPRQPPRAIDYSVVAPAPYPAPLTARSSQSPSAIILPHPVVQPPAEGRAPQLRCCRAGTTPTTMSSAAQMLCLPCHPPSALVLPLRRFPAGRPFAAPRSRDVAASAGASPRVPCLRARIDDWPNGHAHQQARAPDLATPRAVCSWPGDGPPARLSAPQARSPRRRPWACRPPPRRRPSAAGRPTSRTRSRASSRPSCLRRPAWRASSPRPRPPRRPLRQQLQRLQPAAPAAWARCCGGSC